MTTLGLLGFAFILSLNSLWMFWLTRNDYSEGYRAGFFAGAHGMDNDYAEESR